MNRKRMIQAAPAFFIALALIAVCASATRPGAEVARMGEAARQFRLSLDEAKRAKACFAFDSDERLNWHFIPKQRNGLPFGEMTATQAALAHALIATGLSGKGQMKAFEIMSLEEILKELETKSGSKMAEMRKPEAYFISVFGDPAGGANWGWRLEGHHLSLNFTIAGGKIAVAAPTFLGSNPDVVLDGPRKGLRPLGAEEDLAKELLLSLSEGQKKIAVISADAPPDILTKADRKAQIEGAPAGLARSAMTPAQQARLDALIDEYVGNFAPAFAATRKARIAAMTPAERADIRFAWMGGTERGQGRYYRVQGATFLIEYDNTQNDANHSHTVWRDFNGDFGLDLIAEHLKSAHAPGGN